MCARCTLRAHPPLSVCLGNITALDYPYVTTLLPNNTIEIHSVETQSIVQVIPAPSEGSAEDRRALITCLNGFFIPSTQRSEKLRMTSVRLLGRKAQKQDRQQDQAQAQGVEEDEEEEDEDEWTKARGELDAVPDIPALDA